MDETTAPGEDPRQPFDAPPVHRDAVVLEPADAGDPSYLQPPPGFSVRRPEDADIDAIAALYERAADRAQDGSTGRGALRTRRDLQRTWEARRNDALLVLDDATGTVAGYLEFHEDLDPWTPELDAYAEGRVDPAFGARGVGTFLYGRAVERARRTDGLHPGVPTVLRAMVVDPRARTLAWFAEQGAREARHLLQLRLDLAGPTPEPAWPGDTRGVPADTVPLPAVHDALVSSFEDHHLGATDDLATWRELVVERGRIDLAASVAAVTGDGAVVGVALGRVGAEGDPGLAVVSDLGVRPAWRGCGLATALLRACFARAKALGADRVGLEVDDVTLDGAFRLYERAGMEVVHHTVVLALPIDGRWPSGR